MTNHPQSIVKVDLKKVTLSETQLGNLASEYEGQLLSVVGEGSSEINVGFDGLGREKNSQEFICALTCFAPIPPFNPNAQNS